MSFKETHFKNLEEYFPTSFLLSDNIAKIQQKEYFRLLSATILFLILGNFFVGLSTYSSGNLSNGLKMTGLISTFLSVIMTIFLFLAKNREHWYEARALAESIKTITWKYITSSKPFDDSSDDAERDYLLYMDLLIKDPYGKEKKIFKKINRSIKNKDIITDEMKKFKEISLDQKKEIYLENRIKKELEWYQLKSKRNKNAKILSGFLIVIFQFLSISSILLIEFDTDSALNSIGLFSTISASIISWMQAKQYQELSISYKITAQELTLIYNQGKQIEYKKILDFINDAEKAISREHTLWLARRVNTIPSN